MSTIIQVKCTDQVLTYENTPIIASGGVKEDYIKFTFCEKWKGLTKTAVFWRNEKEVYHVMLDETDGCAIPPEALASAGVMYFGVFGVDSSGKQRTSEVLRYNVENGAINPGTKPADPTPDIYMQVMAQFLKFEDEIRAGQADFRAEWEAYQEELSAAWEEYKTGGFYVLKDTYEEDKAVFGRKLSDAVTKEEFSTSKGKVLNAAGELVRVQTVVRTLANAKVLVQISSPALAKISPDGKKFVYIDHGAKKMYLYSTETATLKYTVTLPTTTMTGCLFVLNDLIITMDSSNYNLYIYRINETDFTVSGETIRGGLGWTAILTPYTMRIQADNPDSFIFLGATAANYNQCSLNVYKINKATLDVTQIASIYTNRYYHGHDSKPWYFDGYLCIFVRENTGNNAYLPQKIVKITHDGVVTSLTIGDTSNSIYYISHGIDVDNKKIYAKKQMTLSNGTQNYAWAILNADNLSVISEVSAENNQSAHFTLLDGVACHSDVYIVNLTTGDRIFDYPRMPALNKFDWGSGNIAGLITDGASAAQQYVCKRPFGKMWLKFSNGGQSVTTVYVGDGIDIGGVPV